MSEHRPSPAEKMKELTFTTTAFSERYKIEPVSVGEYVVCAGRSPSNPFSLAA
jgi:hypothetical protein